jgi:hypothetical protein
MWLQEFVPPPTYFLTKRIVWTCWDDESSSHSLIWAKHLDLMAYRHGQKDHCQGSSKGHMWTANLWVQICCPQLDWWGDILASLKTRIQPPLMPPPQFEWDLSLFTHAKMKARLAYQLHISCLSLPHNTKGHHDKTKTYVTQLIHLWVQTNNQHNT